MLVFQGDLRLSGNIFLNTVLAWSEALIWILCSTKKLVNKHSAFITASSSFFTKYKPMSFSLDRALAKSWCFFFDTCRNTSCFPPAFTEKSALHSVQNAWNSPFVDFLMHGHSWWKLSRYFDEYFLFFFSLSSAIFVAMLLFEWPMNPRNPGSFISCVVLWHV